MGSEDLFKKRKAKTASDLKREKQKFASYERVLIVCEGEKTEPNYYSDLIDFHRLNSANVKIADNVGSCPLAIVKHANELFDKAKIKNDHIDLIYCVFDRDTHVKYYDALNYAKKKYAQGIPIVCVQSVPCFEFWLLLHFEKTTKSYVRTQNKSIGDIALDDLLKHWGDYEKGNKGSYKKLYSRLERAIENAKFVNKSSLDFGSENPTTKVHESVEFLMKLNEKKPSK